MHSINTASTKYPENIYEIEWNLEFRAHGAIDVVEVARSSVFSVSLDFHLPSPKKRTTKKNAKIADKDSATV